MKNSIKQRGAAMVEFAIVFPLFLVLVFGSIEYGLVLFDQAVITNASREGARSSIALKVPKLTGTEIETIVLNYATDHLISLGGSSTPTVTITPTPSPLSGPITDIAGTTITVKVDYTYNFLVFTNLLNLISFGAIDDFLNLSATTTMNNE